VLDESAARTECLIALGSNLGDRISHLRFAVEALSNAPEIDVTAISGLYETAPVGGPDDQGAYYNAALRAQSALAADELLAFLHSIEGLRQRERSVHWGARTLDLDLLIYGEEIHTEDTLTLPHPRMHIRRFVMVPACDIAPSWVHPKLGIPMQEILSQLPTEQDDLRLVSSTWRSGETKGHKP